MLRGSMQQHGGRAAAQRAGGGAAAAALAAGPPAAVSRPLLPRLPSLLAGAAAPRLLRGLRPSGALAPAAAALSAARCFVSSPHPAAAHRRTAARSAPQSHPGAPRHGGIDEVLKRLAVEQLATSPTEFASGEGVLDSIVKVYCVYSRSDWLLPWQAHPKREGTGTGFVIRDRLILTNAHVVADQTYITVKRHGSGTKYRADVVAVGHAVDLALLTVADDAFWNEPTRMLPLQLGDVPTLQENVLVIGYPTGGDNTSVTSGVVSRVEVTQYVHAASHLMAIQIDAAINPGNSGGPALRGAGGGNVVVGVAFQNMPSAENIGFIIPIPVVDRFLSEVSRHGEYRGYCSLGLVFQTMENTFLRASLGMGDGASGVLVNRVQPTSPTAKALKRGDVLLAFDGVPIANDGTVHFRSRERIFFTSLITQKPTASTAHLRVLREGQPLEFEVPLQPLQTLVPICKYDEVPSFLMYAGLVFVILSQVLVDDVNTGFQSFQNLQVLRVDGTEVLNLRHLRQLLRGAGGRYIRIDMEDDRMVVLDREAADASTARVQARYRVPFLESADLADGDSAAAAGEGKGGEAGAWGGPEVASAASSHEAASTQAAGGGADSGADGDEAAEEGEEEGEEGDEARGRLPAVPAEPAPVIAAALPAEADSPPRKRQKGARGNGGGRGAGQRI
ncbi:protease Do-like mitochondrial [Raphidocelis subcapitata]|uniref:Protease Do-like mitochondrial n=1 Tax=Raphidocelis subcapitata TaxID=307507 RepID=A0A2V0P8U8_9CHLO|nr:protease Do-like mitochondrial [Raphidocelis subcapitata]|eukprot:GBF95989.1 protease Do-like mitochondrial [Raphidocelis subcapitata]